MQIQVAAFPHWSGSKSDKRAGDRARKEFVARMQRQLHGPDRRYDSKGRRIVYNAAEFRGWLGEHGLSG